MTLTKDQKRALLIAGAIAAVALLFWLLQRNQITSGPVGMDGPADGPLTFSNSPPGYTSYNIMPADFPLAAQPNVNTNLMVGRCCDEGRDGCFTTDPLATGRGPLGMDQLLGWYAQNNPQWLSHWQTQMQTYGL